MGVAGKLMRGPREVGGEGNRGEEQGGMQSGKIDFCDMHAMESVCL
jgi:hypothetical protein